MIRGQGVHGAGGELRTGQVTASAPVETHARPHFLLFVRAWVPRLALWAPLSWFILDRFLHLFGLCIGF